MPPRQTKEQIGSTSIGESWQMKATARRASEVDRSPSSDLNKDTLRELQSLFGRHVAVDDDTLAIAAVLLARLDDPDLRLPILPEHAQRAMLLANDPNVSIIEIQEVVESEPLIALRLMETANSALFSGYGDVSSLKAALSRVGVETVRGVVMSSLMEAHALGGANDARLDTLRKHSILVAHTSRHLCRALDFDAEVAFACGLFHDVGQAILLELIRSEFPRSRCADLLTDVLHVVAGQRLLSAWGLPSAAAEAARYHHAYGSPSDPGNYRRMANVVALADALVYCVGLGDWPLDNALAVQSAGQDLGWDDAGCDALINWTRERAQALGFL